MELVNPGIGLIVWMTLAFLAILYILGKYAWGPIMKSLKERESTIHDALNSAEKAKEEMKKLKFSNEQLLQEAKNERDAILAAARKIKESIIEESKLKATEEANRIIISAKESIENEKMAAIGTQEPACRVFTGSCQQDPEKGIIRSQKTGRIQ